MDKNISELTHECNSLVLPPGWANPIDLDQTALIDSAASISLLGEKARAKLAAIQEACKMLLIPNGADMKTT